jgi:hypothetical protein
MIVIKIQFKKQHLIGKIVLHRATGQTLEKHICSAWKTPTHEGPHPTRIHTTAALQNCSHYD